MKTVTIQVGNSDNKLSQQEWSDFVSETECAIKNNLHVHFSGGSDCKSPWQNYAWVVVGNNEYLAMVRNYIKIIREKYKQESVAWTEGTTEFI